MIRRLITVGSLYVFGCSIRRRGDSEETKELYLLPLSVSGNLKRKEERNYSVNFVEIVSTPSAYDFVGGLVTKEYLESQKIWVKYYVS